MLLIFKFQNNKVKKTEIIHSNEIIYKGSKILKTKLLTDYFSRISINEINKDNEIKYLNMLFNLSEYPNKYNIKNKYRIQFLNYLSKIETEQPEKKKKKINKIETLFTQNEFPFGNCLIIINNLIFYCQIIGCHNIILNTRHSLIKRPLYIKALNITIIPSSKANCSDNFTLCNWNPFAPLFVKPQIRIQYLKEEILTNIPKVNADPKELYIHIRSGDIFSPKTNCRYSQPPLCFYEKIINNNKFKKIYIISIDKKNVVLDALINKYNNIIYRKGNYKLAISSLVHAFNAVAPISSFFLVAIKFNDNLKNLWEYDIYRLIQKFFWLHHDLYKFDIKYKIYTMKPSDIYLNNMYIWRFSKNQLKLMIEDKCPNDFELTMINY